MTLVAVTGASGFVGGVLVRMLLEEGRAVRALDVHRGPALQGLDVEFVEADVTDPQGFGTALDGVGSVFHLVARISIVGDPDGTVRAVNVDGAGNVARAAREAGVRRYLHCSSIHAYDLDVEGVIDEASPRSIRADLPAYDRSKYAGEERVRAEIDQGLDAVIVNPSGIIGPHDHAPSRMGHVLRSLFAGAVPLSVSGAFDWVDVRDVARGMLAAEASGRTGQNYLLPGHRVTVAGMAEACAEVAGRRPPRITLPMWMAEIVAPLGEWQARRAGEEPLFTKEALHALRSDPDVSGAKAAVELGYEPRSFESTVEDTFAWFRDRSLARAASAS